MTDALTPVRVAAPDGHPRHSAAAEPDPLHAVTRLAVRLVGRGAVLVIVVAGGMSALVAAGYRTAVGDDLDARALVALATSPAIRILFGEPVALDSAGGFTVWRTGTALGVLLAVWSFLTVARVTRGEEDAGRWDVLLAGRPPVASVVSRHLAVVVAADVLAGTAATTALLLTGTEAAGAVLHGLGLALIGVFFAGFGCLAAQLLPTRAAAVGSSAALLGVGLLARMLGDGIDVLSWLRWSTPFGLVALVRPYADDRWLPLVVLAVLALLPTVLAPLAAARRDLHSGWVAVRTTRRAHRYLLGSTGAFAVRRLGRPLLGWTVGVAAYYLLIGLLATQTTTFLRDNPRFAELAAAAGFAGLGDVDGYVAALFSLLAIPLGVFAAVRLGAFGADETAGRLTLVLANPVRRPVLLLAEVGAAVLGVLVLALTAGVATVVGTTVVGAPLTLGAALAGVVNVVPIALVCLGVAVAALGRAPRGVAALGALPAVGGFLLHVTAQSAGAPAWVADLSPFAHLAAVPHEPPHWPGVLVLSAVALVLGAAGVAGHRRRDMA